MGISMIQRSTTTSLWRFKKVKKNIRGFIAGFLVWRVRLKFEILSPSIRRDVVMNERVDTLVMGENTIALPVMGIFELANGKIVKWRDYFGYGATHWPAAELAHN